MNSVNRGAHSYLMAAVRSSSGDEPGDSICQAPVVLDGKPAVEISKDPEGDSLLLSEVGPTSEFGDLVLEGVAACFGPTTVGLVLTARPASRLQVDGQEPQAAIAKRDGDVRAKALERTRIPAEGFQIRMAFVDHAVLLADGETGRQMVEVLATYIPTLSGWLCGHRAIGHFHPPVRRREYAMGSGLVFYLLERDDVRIDVLDLCGDGVVVCLVSGDAPCTDLVVEVLQIPGSNPDGIMPVGKYRLTDAEQEQRSDPDGDSASERSCGQAVVLRRGTAQGASLAGARTSLSG